jgi:hypothetical protein
MGAGVCGDPLSREGTCAMNVLWCLYMLHQLVVKASEPAVIKWGKEGERNYGNGVTVDFKKVRVNCRCKLYVPF